MSESKVSILSPDFDAFLPSLSNRSYIFVCDVGTISTSFIFLSNPTCRLFMQVAAAILASLFSFLKKFYLFT